MPMPACTSHLTRPERFTRADEPLSRPLCCACGPSHAGSAEPAGLQGSEPPSGLILSLPVLYANFLSGFQLCFETVQ